jgi:cytochrome c-type protein NapC
MQASKEVWGKIFGTISTREKFLDKRLELAEHEWTRMKANDSLECRNCHSFESMDFTRQSPRAQNAHQRFLGTGEKTCIDCHKGIAHQLPDMSQAMRDKQAREAQAQ